MADKRYRKSFFTIGIKFLSLILITLICAVGIVVFNAINLFEKDNMNNIYVASDLLATAKSKEVKATVSGYIQKGTVLGKFLLSQNTDQNNFKDFFKTFESDSDILFVRLYKNVGNQEEVNIEKGGSWFNLALGKKAGLTESYLEKSTKLDDVSRVLIGVVQISSKILDKGEAVLVINIPLVQFAPGVFTTFVSLIIRQQRLIKTFADTGAYSLALVDEKGQILAHPDTRKIADEKGLSDLPIVKKMMESNVSREFQEYSIKNELFLGAYAKVGIAGMSVISQISKDRALESGRVLRRRSILITGLVLSISFIVAYVFAQTLVSPLRRLGAATKEIAQGNFDKKVNVKTRDEIADLANSFNLMSSEIGRKIHNLFQINEASKTISSTLEKVKLLNFTMDSLLSLLQVNKGIAFRQSEDTFVKVTSREWELDIKKSSIWKEIVKLDSPKTFLEGEFELLVLPIIGKENHWGYIFLMEKKDGKPFVDEDLLMSGTIITSVAITFENIALLEITADKARMEKELETAKLVQDTMFPPTEILLPNLEIQSFYTPASECGGDWWGYIPLANHKVLVAIADATGHGVPAAMITASAKAGCSVLDMIAQHSPQLIDSPSKVMRYLNKAIYEASLGEVLMTFFIAIIDTKNGETVYASASHDPIYWYKMPDDFEEGGRGNRENLDVLVCNPGPRLGQQPDAIYEDSRAKLNPNDILIFYTDGLPEGHNPGSVDEYGESKFMRSIVKHTHKKVIECQEGIMEDFYKFVKDEPLHDDITLAICRFTNDVELKDKAPLISSITEVLPPPPHLIENDELPPPIPQGLT